MTRSEQFARKLRETRQARGLSQERLARRAGLAIDTVHKIEHCKRSPRLDTILLLAGALEVEPAELLKEPRP
jgi:transcriptional regulator with XRE-family HTH domain